MVGENYDNPSQRLPLMPVGGRTALHFGGAVPSASIHVLTEGLNRIIDYPARDMTITVEAGMRIETLQEHLAEENQSLPIDIPQGHRATIGGAIAANVFGPSRYGCGTFRDYLLGISAIDGRGRLFTAGGRVVKNVAGYDLCKLMIGSLGTLGIITQVTLKLTPNPAARAFAIVRAQQPFQIENVLARLNVSATRPVILDVLNAKAVSQLGIETRRHLPLDPHLICIGFKGSHDETEWQIEQLSQELMSCQVLTPIPIRDELAANLWSELSEYQAASDDPVTFRAIVPPSQVVDYLMECSNSDIAVQSHAGNGVVIGHIPDRFGQAGQASPLLKELRSRAQCHGGSLAILNCEDSEDSMLDAFGSPLQAEPLMRSLKETFDPAGVLSPGRFWQPQRA